MSLHHTTTTERRDDLLIALADGHRRAVVSFLRDSPRGRASVSELVDGIEAPDGTRPERVAIRLRHVTLPRLDAVGVLKFDERRSTVTYRGRADFEAVLDSIETL